MCLSSAKYDDIVWTMPNCVCSIAMDVVQVVCIGLNAS